jgi:hypothetical protein
LIWSMSLGQGFHPEQGPIVPPGPECFLYNKAVEWQTPSYIDPTYNAFYLYDLDELEAKLIEYLEPQLMEDSGLLQAAQDAAQVHLGNGAAKVLFLAIRVGTVRREVIGQPMPMPFDALCDGQGQAFSDVAEFIDNCGTQYLSAEELGGYIFMAIDEGTLTRQKATELFEALEINSARTNLGANAAIWAIGSIIGSSHMLEITSWGLPSLTGPLSIMPADWPTIIDELKDDVDLAMGGSNPPLDDASYGSVLKQSFNYYRADQFDSCGLPANVVHAFDCYWKAQDGLNNPLYSDRLKARVRTIDWLLSLSERVEWSDDDAENAYYAYRDQVNDCLYSNVLEDTLASCNQGMAELSGHSYDGNLSVWDAAVDHFCDVRCALPPECTVRALDSAFFQLPPYQILPPPSADPPLPDPPGPNPNFRPLMFSVGHDQSKLLSHGSHAVSVEDELCLFSGWQGKMAGGGEQIVLEIDSTTPSPQWKLRANSGQTSQDSYVRARAHCINRQRFGTGTVQVTNWLDETNHWVSKTAGGTTSG